MADRIAIIADDLTGASDSGVQFVRKGLRTAVLFDTRQLAADIARVDTVSLDTDSRALTADQARNRAEQAAHRLNSAGVTHYYKKMDSTLRGNPGAEVDGVMNAVPFDLAVVAPAFPRLGRTTVGGRHYLHGIDIMETEIARDPKAPATSDVVQLFARQSARQVGRVTQDTLDQGPAAVLNAVAAQLERAVTIIVFDAAREEDLAHIATTMAGSGYRVLWVGSAGLAEYVPEALGFKGQGLASAPLPVTDRPVMLVAGSRAAIARAQVDAARQRPGVVAVTLDARELLRAADVCQSETDRCDALLRAALAEERDIILTVGSEEPAVAAALALGASLEMGPTAVGERIADALGAIAAGVITGSRLQAVIMTGGDTAVSVCRHLGVTGLELLRELETGVPISRMLGGPDLLAVTKAGAFGTEQTLARAMDALRGGDFP
ncbi:MAG: hypothetical protein JWN15_2034 [Firmicutes bacterium]|nr:hypothetical protein [Bacillota bacterium]